ncbi:MAG: M24 family metallopeptidase [Aquificaceae bacterium]|jgi:Xaa-Pro aminopeptidase/Xaa-Pro dipeptidase|uniref:M24 family metallopeptidase n=1 Tax=Hydrogenobacter sp. Uz 6-8 TaxID=3384828 RepID=UPI0030AE8FF6
MKRIQRVQELLKKYRLDAFLFSSQPSVFYLSGFRSSHAYIIVTRDSHHLLTDGRYYEKARSALKGWDVVLIRENAIKVIKGFLKKLGVFRVGYEEDRVSCEFRKSLKGSFAWVGIASFLKDLRMIKDEEELSTMREGVRISDRVYKRLLENIQEGMTELELRSYLVEQFFREGASGESFPAIVASGEGSAIPHYETSQRSIKYGEPLLIDMGLVWKGYCTDFTRTVFLGKANSEFRRVYQIVRDAHLFALDKVRVGKKLGEVDRVAREYIRKKGFGKFFNHSLGHGVGVEIHEFPRVYYKGKDKDVTIKEGMVFTIEPGIYLPGRFGVRLENIVVVNRGVGEPLSKISLDLVEL